MGEIVDFDGPWAEDGLPEFGGCSAAFVWGETIHLWGPWHGISRREAVEARAAFQAFERWYFETVGPYDFPEFMDVVNQPGTIVDFMEQIGTEVDVDWLSGRVNLFTVFLRENLQYIPGEQPWNDEPRPPRSRGLQSV